MQSRILGKGSPAQAIAGGVMAPQAAWVLDTHVLLDLWHFRDARLTPLGERLAQLRWIASAELLAEWQHVAARLGAGALPLQPLLMATPGHPAPWRSRDPDDQKFLDLAWAQRPSLLWTRDKALLAHRKRAGLADVCIETPEQGASRLGWR